MNEKQQLIVMRMIGDPRVPLDVDVFSEAILAAPPGIKLEIPQQNLQALSVYVPDLVAEYLEAASSEGELC